MEHAGKTVQKLNQRFNGYRTGFKHPDKRKFYFSYDLISIAISAFP